MLKNLFTNIWERIAGLRKDCRGFVVMSTLAIFLFLFVLCASIYAVGETIHQRIKLQNACDAAAYSAAVVQADGLSRMAVVNRAMAWSYVQMTNRQMDYITYRWLKLTCKRFEEDKNNAKDYAEDGQIIAFYDKEIGWWALLELAATAVGFKVADMFGADIYCSTGNHKPEHEGWTWWCGAPDINQPRYTIRWNTPLHLSISGMANSTASNYLFTYNQIKNFILAPLQRIIDKKQDADRIENWGYYLGVLIDYDKKNIHRLNKSLERINTQMEISMKMTAENVLKAMLKDNRYDSKSVLQDYYISIHIPHAENPYNAENENNSFFSPLHNTEADEMLFLNMQSANHAGEKLPQHFPVLLGSETLAYGLDQWFIRGTASYDDKRTVKDMPPCFLPQLGHKTDNDDIGPSFYGNQSAWVNSDVRLAPNAINQPVTKREEGMLGIQRVYKDSNLNETKAGITLLRYPVSRGNHVANFSLMAGASDSTGRISKIMDNILSSVMGYFSSTFGDIQASVGNEKNAQNQYFGMCSMVNDTAGLYADYEWASSKWFCLSTFKAYSYTVLKEFKFNKIWCDMERQGRKPSRWNPILSRSHWKKSNGYGHWEFPKHFCGTPSHAAEGLLPGVVAGMIPPIFDEKIKKSHGYMEKSLDFKGFAMPLKPVLKKENFYPRDQYNSCAIFLDGPFRPDTGEMCPAGYLQGHARIYGDDKEIFDNRYVGAICKPWVLNERFFAGEGSIVVGAAMKHTNPFVQLFNFWNTKKDKGSYATGTETQENAEKTVLSAFNIPEGNYMWTMSAARAGVRHRRRNGAFDQERQYQITYDSTSDAENLAYKSGPYVKAQDGNGWMSPEEWGSSSKDNKHVWNGCPCGANSQQFKNMWNLCETDWDATLLPLRYALQAADLYLDKGSGSSAVEGLKLNEQNYNERNRLIGVSYEYSQAEAKGDPYKANDSVIGNGENWVWQQATINNATPVNAVILFQKNGWKKANQPFWEDLFKNLIPEEMQQILRLQGQDNLNLYNKIPEGKEMPEVNPFTLLNQKVL